MHKSLIASAAKLKTVVTLFPPGPHTTEILTGEKVLNLLEDTRFLGQWNHLCKTCPWATVFQTPSFVATWYRVYRKDFIPILIRTEHAGKLTGLLTLAADKNGLITGAGANQAEYQVWLTADANDETFIKTALAEIHRVFPRKKIQLKYIPAEVSLGWTKKEARWNRRCFVKSSPHPLMVINGAHLTIELRKKNRKEKINRLNRLGDLKFERITDYESFASIFDELALQSDFRKGAMYNKVAFKTDPLRKEFLLALFEQNNLHATLLKLDDKIISANVSVQGPRQVHLQGINSFDAAYSRHSPGIIHFLMLGKMLADEGVPVFDLTPGADPYKETLATEHTKAYTFTIGNNFHGFTSRLKSGINDFLKNKAASIGVKTQTLKKVKKDLNLYGSKLRKISITGFISMSTRFIEKLNWRKKVTKCWAVQKAALPTSGMLPIQKDNLKDLLAFDQRDIRYSQQEFLSDAMQRFEKGEHCYTWAENETLLGCAWLTNGNAAAAESGLGKTEGWFISLSGLYYHPSGRKKLSIFLQSIAVEISAYTPNDPFYIVNNSDDNRVFEKAGLSPVEMSELYFENIQPNCMDQVINKGEEIYEGSVSELRNKIKADSGTKSDASYTIELVTGSAVNELLQDPEFQKSWDILFESCPWVTVFQTRQFNTAWYQAYHEIHFPILIKAAEGTKLIGVLPMALLDLNGKDPYSSNKGSKIIGAGHYEAEYQVWLTAPSDGNVFIKKALTALMKQFPGHPISFRFLPPETPLNWIQEDKKWHSCSIMQAHTRPVIHFKNPGDVRLGKHFKNKLNRLKKIGEVNFERIRDQETFDRSLNEMAVLYDFRQGAMFNKTPFYKDPARKDFLSALFHEQLLHTTVLNVNGKMLAAVIGLVRKDWVHLAGLNCHSPMNARNYSPGLTHFTLLSKQLAEEGIQYFDLSPGYDSYKDELANRHDDVQELIISNAAGFKTKRRFKKWIHARLLAAGLRPMTVELSLKRYRYNLRHWRPLPAIKKLSKSLRKKSEPKEYLIHEDTFQSVITIPWKKNSLLDLLDFDSDNKAGLTRWKFLGDAMFRLESGQHCFTMLEGNKLLCCVWLNYSDKNPSEKDDSPTPEKIIVLEKCYCHAAAKDQLSAFLKSILLTHVEENKENSPIRFRVNDELLCKAMESAGFKPV